MKEKNLIYIIIVLIPLICIAESNVINITDRQIWDYWVLDFSKMGRRPELVNTDLYGDSIQFKYEFLIDVDGRPKNFKFISAIPKRAEVEKNKVKRLMLYRRYLPKKNRKFNGATLVHADEKWWKPDPKTVNF